MGERKGMQKTLFLPLKFSPAKAEMGSGKKKTEKK
jgi:hypothetical protein